MQFRRALPTVITVAIAIPLTWHIDAMRHPSDAAVHNDPVAEVVGSETDVDVTIADFVIVEQPAAAPVPVPFEATNSIGVVQVIVGGSVCSGLPLIGTRYVFTAAHCLLDADGDPKYGDTLVTADHYHFAAVTEIRFPPAHLTETTEVADIAVVLTDQLWWFGAHRTGALQDVAGVADVLLQLWGYQHVDASGRRLTIAETKEPCESSTYCPARSLQMPTRCHIDAESVTIDDRGVWNVPCGFSPGGSGGPVVTVIDDEVVLVAVIATVMLPRNDRNGVADAKAARPLIGNGPYVRVVQPTTYSDNAASPELSDGIGSVSVGVGTWVGP
jgi:hypothetical protein